jgi:hypothetical protein
MRLRRVAAGLLLTGLGLTTGSGCSHCCHRTPAPAVVGSSPVCCAPAPPCCGPAAAPAVQSFSAPSPYLYGATR